MAKHCPVNPGHTTREVSLGPNLSYSYCQDCKEDVEYLARQQNQEWENGRWVAAKNQPNPARLGDYDGDEDEYEDDEDDGYDIHGNPPGWNPNPTRTMGAGARQIVLHNDPNSAAHLVQQILMRVFGKDAMEAQYIMMDAHYHQRAVCFYTADDVEAQRKLDEIQATKDAIEQAGGMGSDRVQGIQFTVENAPHNNPAPPAGPANP